MAVVFRRFTLKGYQKYFSTSITTVDSQEIEHFKESSSGWWDKNGPMKGLHSLNLLRVPFIRDGLINEGAVSEKDQNTPNPLKDISILDVGCGGGILTESLARLGARITGIDANASVIDVAKKHAEDKCLNINYIYTTIEDHSRKHGQIYDAVVASEILEHVSEKDLFVKMCVECVKPMGSFFISTMNKTMLANFFGIFLAENLGVVPKGTHQIEKFIEPHKLQRILEDNNVRTKLIHGMAYNIFSNRWYWCSDDSINYVLHGVKYN